MNGLERNRKPGRTAQDLMARAECDLYWILRLESDEAMPIQHPFVWKQSDQHSVAILRGWGNSKGLGIAVPHDGELLHLIFLYHMMLNGIEVVEAIE